jgi:hypothetical protein
MEIKPMFDSLPKGEGDKLEPGVARYALHRYFVQKHGWHVKGLTTNAAERWSDASPTSMFEGRVPDFVLDLLQDRMKSGLYGVEELSILAATLEDLIHSEAIRGVANAFASQSTSVDKELSPQDADAVLKTFMFFHILPSDRYANLTKARLNRVISRLPEFAFNWDNTMMWVDDIQESLAFEEASLTNPFVSKPRALSSFDSVVHLVEEVAEKHGQYQSLECREMKNSLLELGDERTGRVSLANFYKPLLESGGKKHPFSESPDYLRHLGALDETDPSRPSVMVANYLYSTNNCLAVSKFYSVCCISECEHLMAQIEEKTAGSTASAEVISAFVAGMSSDTVASPRNLSANVLHRLNDIAEQHDGSVPIHGRLFAQWMHHVFPSECAYPHVTGTMAAAMTPREWTDAQEKDVGYMASKETVMDLMEKSMSWDDLAPVPLPWNHVEELITTEKSVRTPGMARLGVRFVALALAMVSAAVGLYRMLKASPMSALPMHKVSKQNRFSWGGAAPKSHFV